MKIIFKHSTRCPISTRAKREMDAFLKNNQGDYEFELVDVIDNKPRSAEIAEMYGIRHESPQIIILGNNNSPTWNASHGSITEESIKLEIGN
ncbi:MAG: bacillithiol system redox-active protein YtxJ [bacterium]|nr:bacillithiol system redox-active protein YtxJ [bacterium]